MIHVPGHQQALIKNNIVVQVLSFEKHNYFLFKSTFNKFKYDYNVNLCKIKEFPSIGDAWNGKNFILKPYESWILNTHIEWVPPSPKPNGFYLWNENTLSWSEADPDCGCIKIEV